MPTGRGHELAGPVMTILFSDVVGSTEIYASRGDVAARNTIAVHDELAGAAVETHGGRVVKGLGDGIMAVFPSPRSALAAAVALQRALAAYRRDGGHDPLEVRIGVNAGEVIEEDGDLHGAAVITAARIAARASGGQVLVTDIVARLAGLLSDVELDALGPMELKGFDQPVQVHQVRWAAVPAAPLATPGAPAPTPHRVGRTGLLGRTGEFEDLQRWLQEAVAGDGRLVLIEGEPGIGKTRLVEELSQRAAAADIPVAWGRCVEDEGAPPFWPWHQVLGALGCDAGELLAGNTAAPEGRFVVFGRVVERLRELNRPALVVFDDLHWADHASLLLLAHLVRAVPAPASLLVGTFRSTEPGDLPSVVADLARTRGAQRIELSGLGIGDVRQYLSAISGAPVSEATAREVAAATAGNPFFVGEIARGLREGTWTGAVPASVRDVVRQRIERLKPQCAELLQAASVVGRSFAVATVAVMTGRGVEDNLTLLDEVTTAGLVEAGRIAGEYRFSHALVRSVVEADIPTADRIALHAAAARAIEALYAGRLTPHLSDLARHWIAAAPAGHQALAVRWAERAGDASVQALAYEQGAGLYRDALEVGGATLEPAGRCRLHLALARALYLGGDLPACADSCFAAAGIARDAGLPELVGEAALVLEAIGLPELNERIHDLCVEALERLADSTEHGALQARLLAQLSHFSLYRGEHGRVDELSEKALALARQAGDDDALVAALRARQEALSGPDGREERAEVAEMMLAAGLRLHNPAVSMWGYLWLIDVLLEYGQLSSAREVLGRLAEQVERVGGPLPRWQMARCRAAIGQAQGRLSEAHVAAWEAYQIMEGIDALAAQRVYRGVLIALGHHGRLHPDQLTRFRDLPDDPPPFTTISAVGRALALLDGGDPDEAGAILLRLGHPSNWLLPPFLRIPSLAIGLLAAVRLGAEQQAAALHEMLSAHRGLHTVAGAGKVMYLGPVELQLGIGAAFLGDYDEAIADLEHAREHSSEAGAPGFAAEAACELAHALRARASPDDQGRAGELLAEAARDADALGMDLLAERARQLSAGLPG